jgi:uracil DNA glycosylase
MSDKIENLLTQLKTTAEDSGATWMADWAQQGLVLLRQSIVEARHAQSGSSTERKPTAFAF